METHEETVARIIKTVDEHGGFAPLDDGYVHYWPEKGGALSSWVLRALADECDKRNAVWDATMQASLPKPCVQVWKYADAPEQFRALSTQGGEEWIALVPPGLTGDVRHIEEFNYLVNTMPCPQFPDFEVWIGTPPRNVPERVALACNLQNGPMCPKFPRCPCGPHLVKSDG